MTAQTTNESAEATNNLLDAYRVKPEAVTDGVQVTLERGLVVKLRPHGTPDFFREYLDWIDDVENVTPETDIEATNRALSEACVMQLGEGENAITDKEQIYNVLSDPTYYQLRMELLQQSKNGKNFNVQRAATIKK